MATKFRKKPIVIEAFQMTERTFTNRDDWPEWLCLAWMKSLGQEGAVYMGVNDFVNIVTLEGTHKVSWGDWIIRGVKGELYPCKPDIFAATYEPAESP